MSENLNPQAEQMADESMVRNLAAQAICIWPQEEPLLRRYGLAADIRILDAGCGTGEISSRLAALYPRAAVLGIDIIDAHLALARERGAGFGERLRFENRSLFATGLPDASFDLSVCRHVLQSIPHAERALAELCRVTRPGGRLHLIAEDYGMIHFDPRRLDASEFLAIAPVQFGAALGTDLHIGRRAHGLLVDLGLSEVTVDYIVVDTLRVPRESFAAIWQAWSDGYAEATGQHTRFSADEVRAQFADMIATIRDPRGYGVWFVPVISGVVAAGSATRTAAEGVRAS